MAAEPQSRKTVNLFVDGVANETTGAWACVLEFGGHQKEMEGHMAGTNPTRMEIFAVISGLGALKEPCDVCLYTKSMPLNRAFNARGLEIWPTTGWTHKDGTPVEERDLWQILKLQSRKHTVKCLYFSDFKKLPLNRRCTELTAAAIGEYVRINTVPEDAEVYQEDIPDEDDDKQ